MEAAVSILKLICSRCGLHWKEDKAEEGTAWDARRCSCPRCGLVVKDQEEHDGAHS